MNTDREVGAWSGTTGAGTGAGATGAGAGAGTGAGAGAGAAAFFVGRYPDMSHVPYWEPYSLFHSAITWGRARPKTSHARNRRNLQALPMTGNQFFSWEEIAVSTKSMLKQRGPGDN